MGFLTKRISDKSKREKIIMIVGIFEILALIFFGLTQRWGWDEGYKACISHFCNDLIPNYDLPRIKMSCYNYTGINMSDVFCEGVGCLP